MKFTQFRVTKYRNVWDSGWIDINSITAFVGQNEAGKSNLFEALYRINPFAPNETYNIDEDWPVDDWGAKDLSKIVCEARFSLTEEEIESLYNEASLNEPDVTEEGQSEAEESKSEESEEPGLELPAELVLAGIRSHDSGPTFTVAGDQSGVDVSRSGRCLWPSKLAI